MVKKRKQLVRVSEIRARRKALMMREAHARSARPPARSPRPLPIEWTTGTLLIASVQAHKRKLGVAVTHDATRAMWTVLALEAPNAESVGAVLGDHAHALVGEFKSLPAAMASAERYAKKWWSKRAANKCDCGPIESNSRKRP